MVTSGADVEAWFAHSPDHDFRVKDPPGYIWGLPVMFQHVQRSSLL